MISKWYTEGLGEVVKYYGGILLSFLPTLAVYQAPGAAQDTKKRNAHADTSVQELWNVSGNGCSK